MSPTILCFSYGTLWESNLCMALWNPDTPTGACFSQEASPQLAPHQEPATSGPDSFPLLQFPTLCSLWVLFWVFCPVDNFTVFKTATKRRDFQILSPSMISFKILSTSKYGEGARMQQSAHAAQRACRTACMQHSVHVAQRACSAAQHTCSTALTWRSEDNFSGVSFPLPPCGF